MTGRGRLIGLDALARTLNAEAALHPTLREAGEEVARHARASLDAEDELAESTTVAETPAGVEIGSDHPGARAAEFGTLAQPARPFLQPAFEAALGPLKSKLRQTLKTHLRHRKRRAP